MPFITWILNIPLAMQWCLEELSLAGSLSGKVHTNGYIPSDRQCFTV